MAELELLWSLRPRSEPTAWGIWVARGRVAGRLEFVEEGGMGSWRWLMRLRLLGKWCWVLSSIVSWFGDSLCRQLNFACRVAWDRCAWARWAKCFVYLVKCCCWRAADSTTSFSAHPAASLALWCTIGCYYYCSPMSQRWWYPYEYLASKSLRN